MNAVPLITGDLPEIVEAEDNDSAERAMRISPGVTLSGRFLDAADEDWFLFEAKKDEAYTVDCRPFPPGLSTLPVISLVDGDGKVLRSAKSVDSPERDCRIEWRAPTGGDYRVCVRDVQQGIRGGADFMYRLTVRPAEPDFALTLKSDFVHVIQGGKTQFEIIAQRKGGFSGAIDLAIDALPSKVRFEPKQIPADKNSIKVTIQADKDARPADIALRVAGRANVMDKVLRRVTTAPHWGVDAEGVSVESPLIDNLHLTVRHQPVFRLFCPEAYQYAHRGTVFPYPMELERLDGYDGEIVLQIGDRQNRDLDGVEMFEVTVPPQATEISMPIYLPETMHINIQSQSQLYVQSHAAITDRWGEKQSFLVVSEKRCLIRPMPAVVKLNAHDKELVARPGETIDCRLRLERTTNFVGPMDVELIFPAPESGFSAEKARFERGATRAAIRVRCGEPRGLKTQNLRFRAVGKLDGGVPVISETVVPVRFE